MTSPPRIGTATVAILLQVLFACSSEDKGSGPAGPAAVSGGGVAGVLGLNNNASIAGALGSTPAAPKPAGSPGLPGIAGSPGLPTPGAPGPAGAPAPPRPAGTGALPGFPGGTAGVGAPPMGAAGVGAPMGAAGTGAAGMPAAAGAAAPGDDPFAAERQACVDHINMYRATLMLAPLKRATPEQEKCSDDGAKSDGDTGQAHGSAGKCRGLGGQNTCPGYPVRAGGTLTATMKGCLDQMWAEGEPPNGVQACIADRTGCFLMHGHWINMSQTTYGTVACGFYKMSNGRYWMNQNFGR